MSAKDLNTEYRGDGFAANTLAGRFARIDKLAARLLMISFFLSMKWQVIATGITCIYFLCRALGAKQKVMKQNILWALFLGSGVLLYFIAIPFTPSEFMQPLLLMLQQRISLLLVPVVFAIAGPAFGNLLMGELMFFVYGCFINCLITNGYVFYELYSSGKGMATFSHVQYRDMFNDFNGIHPTYMGMQLCFSICILLMTHRYIASSSLKYFLLFALLIFLVALGPKAPILALALIMLHFAYRKRKELFQHWKLLAFFVLAVAACSYFIPFARQRIAETVQGMESKNGNVIDNSVLMRKAILHMDASAVEQYWLTGAGPGRVKHMLQEHYFFYSLINPGQVPYHDPHSEYVYEWLCFGVAGILLLVSALICQFIIGFSRKNYLYVYLLLIFAITFFTETVLSMQRGVMMYAVFTSVFFFLVNRKPDNVINGTMA